MLSHRHRMKGILPRTVAAGEVGVTMVTETVTGTAAETGTEAEAEGK